MADGKSDWCLLSTEMDEKLRDLKSLIAHARNAGEDLEALVRSLQARPANAGSYRINSLLAVNLKHLREILADNSGFNFRDFVITPLSRKASVVYLEGIVDENIINTHIIEKLTMPPLSGMASPPPEGVVEYLKNTLLTAVSVESVAEMATAVKRLLAGDTLLLVDGVASVVIVATRSVEYRAISEPETETAVRAPREGFVEGLGINIAMLRRRLKSADLVVNRSTIGERSDTDIAVIYFRGIANTQLVCEVERRLKKICIDMPVGIGMVEGLIEDYPYSPFPTIMNTERPDKVAAALVEGKVGIIMDGTPFCLVVPGTLPDFFQTSDDYNEKWLSGAFFRFIRYMSAFFAVTSPAIFVAITAFHPGFIPTPLAITIANARLGIPFPGFIEAIIMEAMLEILQEAGIRLPKTIGPAVSIVGGLVIGEATVRAGLISAPMVIVIAFTAIASFNVANYRINILVRLLRVPFLILGATLGIFGVMVGLLAIGVHISLMESFGVPYLAPVIPKNAADITDLKDSLIVVPPAMMDERPAYLSPEDDKRQAW